jgi:phospholipid transport system substrate-binding protein
VEGKINAFENLLNEQCHTELMAKLVLGRSGWAKLSPEQLPEFIHEFIRMMTCSYYTKMDMADISTIKISYGDNEEVSPVKRVINATIADDVNTYRLEYKYAFLDGRWGIYDLVVEGVSLLASYRSEYADYLTQHSGAELIAMLRQKADCVAE